MRKTTVCVAAAAMALTMALAGCGSSSSTSGSTTSEASSQQEQSQPAEKAQTAEQDFSVTIDSCTQDTDYEGNPTVDITFTFTNNSDEAQSLATMANIEVYQDGVQRDMAISTSVDTSGYTTNVKPGVSTQATLVYSVSGTSDVEVEVYPLVSLDKMPVAQQTFALS